jgi:prepilin-type N-terminal cleavage/methylation domain-containing protein
MRKSAIQSQVNPDRSAQCRGDQGFTLVEMAVAMSVGVLCLLVLGQALSTAAGSSDSILKQAEMLTDVQRGIERLRRELQSASPDLVEVSTHADGNDVLVLKTAGPYTGAVRWGAHDQSGEWMAGWSSRFRVTGGQLVREVVDLSGSPRGEPLSLARGVMSAVPGEKGFSVQRSGSLFTIDLRVRREFRDGNVLEKNFSTAIKTLPGLFEY